MAGMKLAIVGGGPSAFYVASRLLSLFPSGSQLRIHMFDRLWAPHGLVRYGVAPDHPEVKNCTNKFDATASDPRFRFFGNVNIGSPSATSTSIPHCLNVPLSSICSHYSHLLFASGCTLPTLHEALPPSQYCTPALSLVHWYTQHPSRPKPPPLERCTHVSLIGNGNVSLDIARMLLTSPDVLSKYDVPVSVLDVLHRSNIRHISIIARRGPLEAAFTTKELRELINLPEASMTPIETTLLNPPPGSQISRQQSRILDLLRKGSRNPPGSTKKTWSLDFFRSPTGLAVSSPSTSTTPVQLSLAHTRVDPTTKRAVPTGETSVLPTSLVVTSLGFHAEPTMAFYDPALGHLRTAAGRVVSREGKVVRNVYASGWAANGAKGVLASTMMDAYAVADAMLEDFVGKGGDKAGEIRMNSSPDLEDVPPIVQSGLERKGVLTYVDWKKIDEEECRRGASRGKDRDRLSWEEVQALLV